MLTACETPIDQQLQMVFFNLAGQVCTATCMGFIIFLIGETDAFYLFESAGTSFQSNASGTRILLACTKSLHRWSPYLCLAAGRGSAQVPWGHEVDVAVVHGPLVLYQAHPITAPMHAGGGRSISVHWLPSRPGRGPLCVCP